MINIKELFKSDLDPNNQDWWSGDKIDKINYNFYQLSNGGMPGPQGKLGPDGDFGAIGPIGNQGAQGYQGVQGPIGFSTESDWVYYEHTATSPGYLFPKRFDATETQYTPSVMRIGADGNDTLLYDDPALYNEYAVLSNLNSTSVSESIQINLRLQHDTKVSDFILTDLDELKVGKIVTSDPGFRIVHDTGISSIKVPTSGEVHTIGDSGAEINIPAILNDAATTNDSFSYNHNAQIGYLLSADDSAGNVNWKNKTSVFAMFPIGSIMSVRESDFTNATNFHLTESINSNNGVLQVKWGRGKVDTDYAGWYLCNGKTWTNNDDLNYLVPNLNSFNYSISANGAQYEVIGGGNDDTIIIGGYDISVDATQVSGVYNVGFENTWTDNNTSTVPNTILTGGSISAYLSKMVHIVYLGDESLIWKDSGL